MVWCCNTNETYTIVGKGCMCKYLVNIGYPIVGKGYMFKYREYMGKWNQPYCLQVQKPNNKCRYP